MVQLLQRALDRVLNWGETNGLTFAAAKTVAVVFTHKRDGHSNFPQLHLSGQLIKYSEEV